MELLQNEQLNFDVFANLFRGMEGVGGKLKITDRRLVFESHAFNIQTGVTEIYFSQIAAVKKRNTGGIVPNGMSVITKDGFEFKFVLWHRTKIIDFLNSQIK